MAIEDSKNTPQNPQANEDEMKHSASAGESKSNWLSEFGNYLFGKADYSNQPQIRRAKILFTIMLGLMVLIFGLMINLHFKEYNCVQNLETCPQVRAQSDKDASKESATGDTESESPVVEKEALSEEKVAEGESSGGETAEDGAVEEDAAANEEGEAQTDTVAAEKEDETASAWMGKYQKPPWQWLDWVLAALVGVLLYGMANIAYYYQKAYKFYDKGEVKPANIGSESIEYPSTKKELSPEKPKFINFTPWYISTIVKAPIVTIVILVFLTNIDFAFAGVDISFGELQAQVLLMIAFVLGFYSRVAREQLNVIVKALFGRAYSRAEEVFSIVPSKKEVVFGGNCKFNTSPYTEVTWVTSAGTIDSGGLFVAPATAGDKEAASGRSVLITAVPTNPNIPRATAVVTLVPFEIMGPQEVEYGKALTEPYKVDPAPAGGVTWSVVIPDYGAKIEPDKGILTGPDQATAGAAKYITIKATSKDDVTMYAEQKIYLKASNDNNN